MATTIRNEPVRRADQDNVTRIVPTSQARQGVITGRVLTVLIVSVVAIAVIFAIIWLTKGNVSP